MVEFFYIGDYEGCDIQLSPVVGTDETPAGNPADEERNDLTPLRLHAQMFALAEMYQVDPLQSLAVAKYIKDVEMGATIEDMLQSIPDIYDLTPISARSLRDKAVIAVRTKLRGLPRYHNGVYTVSATKKVAADILIAKYDDIVAETPEFLKDLLSLYIHTPLLWHCTSCVSVQPKAFEAFQMKCLDCGKEGGFQLR